VARTGVTYMGVAKTGVTYMGVAKTGVAKTGVTYLGVAKTGVAKTYVTYLAGLAVCLVVDNEDEDKGGSGSGSCSASDDDGAGGRVRKKLKTKRSISKTEKTLNCRDASYEYAIGEKRTKEESQDYDDNLDLEENLGVRIMRQKKLQKVR